ncbi:MAG: hypothetical protein BRD38_02385 [Bacteroidetes bacterium QH_9_67_14]|nr:MAG: hypothetical protein BRD38_02385 [Bacteroidetes bacterium QH_9_67_14]
MNEMEKPGAAPLACEHRFCKYKTPRATVANDSPEPRAESTRQSPDDALARAAEYGVDLSQLRERLRLSPTERWEYNKKLYGAFREFRKAGREHYHQ